VFRETNNSTQQSRFHLYSIDPDTNAFTDTGITDVVAGTQFVGHRAWAISDGWILTRTQGTSTTNDVRFVSLICADGNWTITDTTGDLFGAFEDKQIEDSVYCLTPSVDQALVIHPESTFTLLPDQYFALDRTLNSTNNVDIDPWGESNEEFPDFSFEEWGMVNGGTMNNQVVATYLVRKSEDPIEGSSLSAGEYVDLHLEAHENLYFDPDYQRNDIIGGGMFIHLHLPVWDGLGCELQISTAFGVDTTPIPDAGYFYGFYDQPYISGGNGTPDIAGELTEKRQKFARSPTDYTA
jgi:hypothetical protein